MPSVFTFSRSDSEILQELLRVFSSGRGTAREQWSLQAELLVEPVGWDALWKLSKDFCKKFEVRFPCIAYVTITSVDFEALSACVDVLSVQHETVSLPEMVQDVPLVELWPTIKQREKCINAATTAEFIDLLRFYYNDIWMPWDDQDDKVLLPNTIEDRMSLWSELHNGAIPNCVARSITLLRSSAINAHDKLKELDSSLCEGELADEDDSLLPPNYISLCAEMNARLDGLMSKWTLYENPLIREQYLAKAKSRWQKHKSKKNVTALWRGGSVFEFDEISKFLKCRLNNDQTLTVMVSAEDALAMEPEEVVVCSKSYEVPEMPLSQISICSFNGATLQAADMRSCLLMLSEECRLQDLQLRCSLVNAALLMRAGELRLTRCAFTDSPHEQSDFAQGIVAMSGAKIFAEDCTFDNFYSGIVVHKGAQVELRNCVLKNCGVGIQMYSGSQVLLRDTTITGCSEQSVRCELDMAAGKRTEMEGLQILGNCKIGSGKKDDILIVQQDPELTVTTRFVMYCILKNEKKCDLTCFESILVGGAKLHENFLADIRSRLRPGAMAMELLGQTETMGPVLAPNASTPIGSCGSATPAYQIQLVDPDTNTVITEPSVTGELWVKGDMFTEYYNSPEDTARVFSEDGWFKSGDLLRRDKLGNFYYVDRLKVLIKYQIYHISPSELEKVIRRHPCVFDVAVTSVPHPVDFELPVACVVPREGATIDKQEILDLVADNLSEKKRLRGGVIFLKKLPHMSTGKISIKQVK